MRIGIDNISPGQSTGRQAPGGMRMYLQALLREFAIQAPHHQFVLFTPTWGDPLLEPMPTNVEVVRLLGVPVSRPWRVVYQHTGLAAAIARRRLDVFFATATVVPLPIAVPVVLTVQFLQFYEIPEAYGRFRAAYLRCILPLSLRKATEAIIFTEHSKRDLVRWTGVPSEKVHVVPHGLSRDIWRVAGVAQDGPERRVGVELTGGQPYILYVSSTYGYKNHARLIRAFGLLKRRTNLSHVLLLVGSEVNVSFAELRSVADQAGVSEDVIFSGRLDHHLTAATYLGADLAAVPTLYETFGYPVVEAMACGCPLVISNVGSMAELAGDAAVLVDPFDEESIADGMIQVLVDLPLCQSLIMRGRQRAKEYTCERSAAQTLTILEKAGQGVTCAS